MKGPPTVGGWRPRLCPAQAPTAAPLGTGRGARGSRPPGPGQASRGARGGGRGCTPGTPAGPFSGQRGGPHSPTRGRPPRASKGFGDSTALRGRGRWALPLGPQQDPCPPRLRPPSGPAPEATGMRRPIRSSRESASSCQPMGGSDGAVALPGQPIRAGGRDSSAPG